MRSTLKKQNGFTMVETMVVVVVAGITLAASIPSFSKFMRSNDLKSGGEQMASSFRLMRQAAIAKGTPYVLLVGSTYYYHIEDTNGDGFYSSGEKFWGPIYMPKGMTLNSLSNGFTSTSIGFNSNGSTNQGGNLNMSNNRGQTLTLTLLRSTGQIFIKRPDDA